LEVAQYRNFTEQIVEDCQLVLQAGRFPLDSDKSPVTDIVSVGTVHVTIKAGRSLPAHGMLTEKTILSVIEALLRSN
jgi:hypothetical protein